MLFLLILILPFFVSQVESGTSTNTLYAHAETTTIGGVNYYLHKLSSADGPATTLSQSAVTAGRKLMGRWVYPLSGIVSISASTWTVTYRAMKSASASSLVAHYDVDILIRKSDNTIRTTIATNVANSPTITLVNVWQTLTGTYSWATYTVVDQTDYLEVVYYIDVTTPQNSKSVRLLVDDSTLPLADQTRIANVIFAYPNQAPVASFTYSPAEPRAEQIVTFNASASYDPDGNIVSYRWDFGDGNVTTVTDPIITHVYVECGNRTVTLTVTDNEGLASSASETVPVINPSLLRIWADVSSYVGSHSDAWIHESWVVSSNVPAGGSVSFNLYIDAMSNLCGADPTYDVYLAVAVNDTAQVASITVGLTTITTFTYGQVTWPNAAGGGTLSLHGVYPTWYALAPFGDVASNHGYYTTPGNPYGPYWAYRAYIPVTITAISTMDAGFKVHFDAQGVLVRGSTKPGYRNTNSFSHDLTFEGSLYTPLNNPPVAYDQSVTTPEDTPKDITLTASDPDSDPLTYFIVTGPSHGSLSGSPPSVTYTLTPNYNGADSFTFKAYDGKAYSNIATVSITVTPVNDPPTAPVVDVTPNLPLTTDNLVCTVTTPSTDPDRDTITYIYEWYKNGVLQSDETAVTTALTDTVSLTKTAKGEVWKCVVTPYDGMVNGTSAQDQVTIGNSLPSIEGVNITPDPAYKTSTLTATPYGWSDADGDVAQYLYQWQKWNGASWQDILGATSSTLGPDNFLKEDQIKVICTPFDGEDYGASKEDTITISNSPPSAPVIDVTPDFPVTTDDLVCIIITPSIDPDGDPVTYTYEWYKNDILQPAYTTNTVPASATTVGDVWKCVVTPHGSAGPPSWDQVIIQNSPPVLDPIGPKSVDEGTMLSFTATATDPDVPPQTLTFSLGAGTPAGASITGGGAFSWIPTEVQGPGSYVIRIIVSDGIAQDSEDITVTVNEVNQPPVLNPIGPKTVSVGNLLQFTVTASDPDLPTQTLTSSASNLPLGATFNHTTRVFSWTPTSGQAGVYLSVHFEVSDGYLTDSEDTTITVTAPPQPPVGGYSISLTKQVPASNIAAYTMLIVLFGAALSLIKRKRK
jgi:PKD repeat protein